MSSRLTLASRSPQRRAILDQLGIEFTVAEPVEVDEITEGIPPEVVVENAVRKARSVEGERVLGVDTEVFLDGRAFGKPSGVEGARSMLAQLSGRSHEVWSGIALREQGEERISCACTRVRFGSLDPALLDWYLDSGEWEGRAGGYAIQGRGAALVESIDGDFWDVVGLPVPDLLELAPDLFR